MSQSMSKDFFLDIHVHVGVAYKKATEPKVTLNPVRIIYGSHHDLGDRYGISVSQKNTDIFSFPYSLSHHLILDLDNTKYNWFDKYVLAMTVFTSGIKNTGPFWALSSK